jgi:hypothetical protein
LKKDLPRVRQVPFRILSQSLAPLCLHAPLLYARAVAHALASLGHPDRVTLTISSLRKRLTWCAACSGGARQGSSVEFVSALLPSAISPPGSSCCSPPTSPAGWHCRSRPSFCCCWRSSGISFSTSCPTPSSRWPSSSTYARCS